MTKTVHLNGGPWHDRVIALQEGVNYFKVLTLDTPTGTIPAVDPGETPPVESVPTREGMYSRVGHTLEFEWDGLRPR